MVFSSEIFLFLFLPFTLFIYYGILLKSRMLQNTFLLIMSLVFYAYGEPWFVFVMIFSILWNWFLGLLVDKFRTRKRILSLLIFVMLVTNLGILAYFKYWMFILGNINYFIGSAIPIPRIMLPIGISFFIFQEISYVLDVARNKGQVQKNPLHVGLYIALFPQLIAGPIVRYETIAEQILNRKEKFSDFSEGVCRFIIGMSKKMLIANSLAQVADAAYQMPANELSVAMAWLGVLAFTFQIYFDFSGYSDMAIGLGRMFGFKFLENFNYPYISTSIREFWRRWHISLGSFFRDYVYIPLGGNQCSTARWTLHLFLVWALTGLWHGADWAFVLWGLLFFVFIVFEKYVRWETRFRSPWFTPFKYCYVFCILIIGWGLFKSGYQANLGLTTNSLALAASYFKTMIGVGNPKLFDGSAYLYWHENQFFYLFAVLFSMPIVPWMTAKCEAVKNVTGKLLLDITYAIIIFMLFLVSVSYVIKDTYNPFIYFNF